MISSAASCISSSISSIIPRLRRYSLPEMTMDSIIAASTAIQTVYHITILFFIVISLPP